MEATQSCVQNGGWLSSWFPTERGIRHGCPLSPLLFRIAVEILALRIRNNPDVRGIQVNEDRNENLQTNTTKIKQFADDTTLAMNDEKDMKLAISIVEQFQEFSGLRLNKRKSEGIWMGSRKHERGRIHDIPMKGMIQILGIFDSAEKEASTLENNWTSKIENLIRTIKQWENRNPTLYGKVSIAKTLLLSQFSHVLQVLALPQSVLTRINTIIYRFLWKRKYNNKGAFEKIKRSVLSLDIEEGGVKMIHIENQQKRFLAKWTAKLLRDKKTVASQIAKHFFTPIVSVRCALNATVDPKHNQAINQIESHFWREATKATTLMNKNREPDLDSIRSEPIWNNKNIKFKGHPLFYRNWCKAGSVYLQDLWVNGHIMRYEQIEQTVGTNGRLLFEYNALVNAIPESWKTRMDRNYQAMIIPQEINTEIGPLSNLTNKKIRNVFDKLKNHNICAANFWKQKMNVKIEDYFSIAHESTKESRLRLLHFQFIHNIYPTNILFNKMGLATTKQCLGCTEIDYMEHAFYQCTKLENFWTNVKQYILINYDWRLEINEKIALFSGSKAEIEDAEIRKKVNHIILIAKLAISKYKYGKCKNLALIFEAELKIRSHEI